MAVIHIAFMRYHNHLTETTCTQGEDEDRFQCARRLTIAAYQGILYNEFLPVLTGSVLEDYSATDYDEDGDPATMIEANIAFRFHFAVPRGLPVVDSKGLKDVRYNVSVPFPGAEAFSEPGEIPFGGQSFGGGFPFGTLPFLLPSVNGFGTFGEYSFLQVARGMANTKAPQFNEVVSDSLRNLPLAGGGLDIPTLTLKRHEQLGIPSYLTVREHFLQASFYDGTTCNEDLTDSEECFEIITGDQGEAQKLRDGLGILGIVQKVKNIPLWTGFLYEKKVASGILGETQSAVLREQLRRARNFDRFYWGKDLSTSEKNEVEDIKLSDIIEIAFGGSNPINFIQEDVFVIQ